MPDYIPQDWPNQKAKIPTGFLTHGEITAPFTAMAEAMGKLGQGISSLGKGFGKGGGQQEGPDDETLKEYATQVGESQVPDSFGLGGSAPQGGGSAQPTVPEPTVSTTVTGEDVINRGGGNPFHEDNRLGAPQGSNRAAVQPSVPSQLSQGGPLTAAPQQQSGTSAIQAIYPPAPGSVYPPDQMGSFAGFGPKGKMMESAARMGALGKVTPGLEAGIHEDRLNSPGDPEGFKRRVKSRLNTLINGDPDNNVPGVKDPILQGAIRDTTAKRMVSEIGGIRDDLDAKTAKDHYVGAVDTIKSNAAKIDNLAFQGGVWLDPKTGEIGMSKDVQGMLLDNKTLRQSLVNDKRQNYPAATAEAETQAQAASMLKESVIGQISRNFQKDWDRPSAEKALKEAFTGPGSERYNFTAAQRAAAVNEGMTSLDNFDTRNKAAIKENSEAVGKMLDIWRSDKGKPDPMLYNKMIKESLAVGDVDAANRLERERPLIGWSQSIAGASAAQRDQAQRELMHASLTAGGVGSHMMSGASPEARQFFTSRGGGTGGYADEAHFNRLNPEFTGRAMRAIQEAEAVTGHKVRFESFGRSTEEQAKLYAKYQAGTGGLAAPPGRSRHEAGNAVDIADGPALTWLHQHRDEIQQKYGVEFLGRGHGFEVDEGHFQLSGAARGGGGTVAHIGGPAEQQMSAIATKFGFNPDDVRKYIAVESGGNARNQTGSYKGLLSLSDSEFNRWKARPGADIWNPQDNLEAGLRKMKAEGAEWEAKTGRKATPFDLWMIHNRGIQGYANAVKDPDSPAFMSMLNTGEGKSKGVEWAKKTIWMNPPSKDFNDRGRAATWTNKDFVEAWRAKFDGTTGGGGYTPATSPIFSVGHRPTDFGGGDVRPKGPAPLSLPAARPAAGSPPPAGPTAPAPLAPPADLYSQSKTGFVQAYAESLRIAGEQASRSVADLEKLQEKGYPVKIEDVDRAAELAQYSGNREAHDKLEMLHTALDIKNGIPPGTTHAQRSAALDDVISNADNPHLAAAALMAKQGLDANTKTLRDDPLEWGARGLTNKLGDVLANPELELRRRAADIPRIQLQEPDVGAISAIRPGEAGQVAQLLMQGDPKQAKQFLAIAQETLGGPTEETYRATMAQPEIAKALVAMAGNPDPNRQVAAMGVLDGLFKHDPNAFGATYGETGFKRLQLWQGMQGQFPPEVIAEKIANADDPQVREMRQKRIHDADKQLGTAGEKLMNIQTVADRLWGGIGSGFPLIGSRLFGAKPSMDQNTADRMAVEYERAAKEFRADGLSFDAAQTAADNAMRKVWLPSPVNGNQIMKFAPEAVSAGGQKYYPELPDKNGGKSQDWMQQQLYRDLEAELGPEMTVRSGLRVPGAADPGSVLAAAEIAPAPERQWRFVGLVSDDQTQGEAQRGDITKPPTYQVMIERNGAIMPVLDRKNMPKRFSFDRDSAIIEANRLFQGRISRSQAFQKFGDDITAQFGH